MTNFNDVKNYIGYVRRHRKEFKAEVAQQSYKYNPSVRGCINITAFMHDLDKIFTFKLFKYTKMYKDTVESSNYLHDLYNKPFSKHDDWIYSPAAVEYLKGTVLFSFINRFDKTTYISSLEQVYELIDNIKTLCGMFGESPQAFYLRNYNCFRLAPNALARKIIEDELEIWFDDYFDFVDNVTVHQMFDKNNEDFSSGFAYHVFLTCLTKYNVNIYEALELDDCYLGINDQLKD